MKNPPPTELPPLCREIQAQADALGYPVKDLLEAAGVWRYYWSRWIRGEHTPTLATMGRIKAVQTGPAQPQGAA